MRITVFGATGRVGRMVVTRALADGHNVTAFARDPAPLGDLEHPHLAVVESPLADERAVFSAIEGADAVISTLGPDDRPIRRELSEGMRNIVHAMERHGVRRLVALSTASVRDPADRFDPAYRLLVGGVSVAFHAARLEIIRMADEIRASDTDWTLVRIGLLSNGEAAPVRIGHYGRAEVGMRITATSLAELMLSLAVTETSDLVRQAPAVSN